VEEIEARLASLETIVRDGAKDLNERRTVIASIKRMLPALENIVDDAAFKARQHLEGQRRWKKWQVRLGVISASAAIVTVIVGEILQIVSSFK